MGIVVTFQAAPLVFLGNIENTNLLKLSLFCWNLFRTLVINTNPFMVDYGQSWQATSYVNFEAVYLGKTNYWEGEGNGTPLQYSCLENPMDRGAW